MKKNRMMRLASILLVCVLLTTSVISGTFAKYTTSVTVEDDARVAYWGFQQTAIADFELFKTDDTGIKETSGLLAPGSNGSASFAFKYDKYSDDVAAPEVDYTFKVEVTFAGSEGTAVNFDELDINENFTWKLEKKIGEANATTVATCNTLDELEDAIEALAGANAKEGVLKYEAGTLPEAFNNDNATYIISWEWLFEGNAEYAVDGLIGSGTDNKLTQDEYDTYIGNMDNLNDLKITIKVSATQET